MRRRVRLRSEGEAGDAGRRDEVPMDKQDLSRRSSSSSLVRPESSIVTATSDELQRLDQGKSLARSLRSWYLAVIAVAVALVAVSLVTATFAQNAPLDPEVIRAGVALAT